MGVLCAPGAVRELRFLPPDTPLLAPCSPLAQHAADAIFRWLDDPAYHPDLPFATAGTAFQNRVWQAIREIPLGQMDTYGAIAARLGSAARAVGQACGANPFPLFVPCHRVVSATGIGGFSGSRDGYQLAAKRWLLAFEAQL